MAKSKKDGLIWKRKLLHISHKRTQKKLLKKRVESRKQHRLATLNESLSEKESTPENEAVTSVYTKTEEVITPTATAISDWGRSETVENFKKVKVAIKRRRDKKKDSNADKDSTKKDPSTKVDTQKADAKKVDIKQAERANGDTPLALSGLSGKYNATPAGRSPAVNPGLSSVSDVKTASVVSHEGSISAAAKSVAQKKLNYILNRRRKTAVKTKVVERATSGSKKAAMAAAKKSGSLISAGLKAAFAATKALVAALLAAGSGFIVLIVAIAAIAVIAGSGFGLFFNDDSGGMTVQTAIISLNQEYIQKVNQLESQNRPYDSMAVYGSKPQWKDVLTIYAAETVSGEPPLDVTTIDEARYKKLSEIFWKMTSISTERTQTTKMVKEEVDILDEAGNPTGEKEIVYKPVTTTIFKINITPKSAADLLPSLSPSAQEQAKELLREENAPLWTELLGGIGGSSGALYGDPAIVATYLLGQGFTPEATAAILGNIKAECGWNYSRIGVLDGLYHPYERNIGIFQFTTLTPNPNSNDEYWRFMRWCRNNGLFYGSLHAQLDWAFSGEPGTSHWTTRWVNRGRYYSNAPGFTEELYAKRNLTPESFMIETDVAAATYSWMAFYEGCTNGTGSHLDRRLVYAYEYYDQLMTLSPAGLIWPTASNHITSYFGPRESPGGIGSTYHKGIDIAAPIGTPISAATGGTVIVAGYSATAGNWVKIDHGNGLQTVYMHCDTLYVQKGQEVSQGDIIAATGNTGNSTGPHLHFGVMVNGDYKNPLDFVSPPA